MHGNLAITDLNDLYLPIQEAIRTVQPIFLLYLVSYFMPGSSITKLEAYLYAMGVTLSSMLSVVLHQLYFFNGHRTGMHLRIATTGCVYRKASVIIIFRKFTTCRSGSRLSGSERSGKILDVN